MKVVVTDEALTDLLEIGRSIAAGNPARAETFIDELYERCLRLGSMPRAFPLLPEWEARGIRRRPHGAYLIFYPLTETQVEIIHILHGARDYEAILFPDR